MLTRFRARAAHSGGGDARAVAAPWAHLRGPKRIMAEFGELATAARDGAAPVHDLELVGDDVSRWRFKMRGFDDDVEGGRQLNADLARLARRHGQDSLLMEASFPASYPDQPFAVRVITPRCVWYTGHVTAGGSICIEALTQTGSPNAWRPDYCVHGILTLIKTNMIMVERVFVRTATGPGGEAGPLRVDLDHRFTHNVMQPYSEQEARAAFDRMVAHHRTNGW